MVGYSLVHILLCVSLFVISIFGVYSGEWKNKSFKSYNFDALGVPPTRGHYHPLMKVRTEIRQIFLEMGYDVG